MKNRVLIILAFVSASLGIVSCENDFLETESTNLTDNAVFADSELTDAFIRGLYTSIRIADKEPGHNGGDTPAGFGRGFHWAMWNSVSDEAIYSNDDATYLVQRGQLSPSNFGFMSTTWGRSFRNIREVNIALSQIETSPFDAETKTRLIAELHFIRAYRYFELLRGFGKTPIVGDEIYQLDSDFSPLYDRKEIPEVVSYIESELAIAISGLPDDNGARATRGAAMALKARVLLYAASPLFTGGSDDAQKWQSAATAAKDVMDMGKYSLVTNLDADPAENFRKYFVTQGMTSEDIFMRFYVQTSTSGGRSIPIERMNGPNGSGGWGGNGPMQNFVDDFEMSNGDAIDDAGSGYDEQDPYADRDPRFYATVVYNGLMFRDRPYEPFLPGGKDSPEGNEPWNTSKTGYLMRKFMREDITLNDWNDMGSTPWRYFRYAEILLNFAEAQNEVSGPNTEVYAAINEVRSRAGMPDLVGLSKEEMRARIWNERRVELAFEEHRYFDVRRWLIAMDVENEEAGGVYITKEDDESFTYDFSKIALSDKTFEEKHYWFPIPLDEITASGGALEQNPNY